MARQTIQLAASNNTINRTSTTDNTIRFVGWIVPSGRTRIDRSLTATAGPRHLSRFEISATGSGQISLELSQLASGTPSANQFLSRNFETNGHIRIATSAGSVTIILADSPSSSVIGGGHYRFAPGNLSEVQSFVRAHTFGQTYTGTLTLSDEPLFFTAKFNGKEATAAKYNGIEIAAAKYNGIELI